MSVIGTRVLRREDPRFLTVGGTYTADVGDRRLDGAGHVTFVRSTMAHAELAAVDVTEAREAPGVLGVFTADDLGELAVLPMAIPGMLPDTMARPMLARGRVRFVGEPVAVVVTERAEQGEDAAERVIVDYDPLDPVVDLDESASGATLLFPEAGTNVALDIPFGHSDDLFDGCEVVVSERLVNQRLAACPMEARAAACAWDGTRLVVWVSSQAPHGAKRKLATVHGLDPADVHVIAPDVGGGFGAKIDLQAEELVLPFLARALGRPVRWFESRSENMVAMPHGRAQEHLVEIGGRRDGTIEAYRLTVLQDAGAYPAMGAVLPFLTRAMAPGTYAIPKVECNVRSVVTTTTPVEAYRGAGRPEATAAIERAVDLFAAKLDLDPAEVRRRNLIPADAFPVDTGVGTTYDSGAYEQALDLALDASGYAELRAEQARRRHEGDPVQLGIGVCTYVEITAGPSAAQEEFAKVEVHPDGTATVFTGASAHGQGHQTSWAMIANDRTGIPMDDITVVAGDTDKVAEGTGTFGSRSLQVGGAAVYEASDALVERARRVAAELLEASPDDVVLDTERGRFHVAGSPAITRTWAEVASAADRLSVEGGGPATGDGLAESFTFVSTAPTFPFGAHVAVVEVDTETGLVRLRRIVTCDDAGRLLNPLIVEGQRHGGIAQGVAQALYEEVRFDDDGNPQTANFADYSVVSAAELPSFELVPLETPTPHNPLGAKGIGESGTIGATPAVQSAVIDALRPYGVVHLDMPLTPEKVWRAIAGADPSGRAQP